MKLLKKNISSKDGGGMILLRPETSEDLWHAYNLIQEGDSVRCTTLRKVSKESSTGSITSNKMRMSLTIEVSKVEFDPDSLQVRLSGKNIEESNFVRLGAYHTLTLELDRNFSIEKICWDQIYLDRIDEACNPELDAEIAAVVMSTGLAHLCLVTGSVTVVKARIDTNIPKKRTGSSNHSKAITRFHEAIYQAILRHIDFNTIKCLLLASPGYVKDDFFKYLQMESIRRDDRPFIENKSKFILCKASSGHKHALEEIFSDSTIVSRLDDTKFAQEVQVLNQFMRMIDVDPDRAYYGYDHVKRANNENAIDSLLITDELFRNSNIKIRKQYVSLVENVRENGGIVYIFSTLHVSGQQLQQVSGIASILRFPLLDLDELEDVAAEYEQKTNNDDDDDDDEDDEEEDNENENQERNQLQEDMQGMGL